MWSFFRFGNIQGDLGMAFKTIFEVEKNRSTAAEDSQD
jgi:hypothetical protein